ncbi:MAG: cbb3-type cytochrome oxidase assembly protein CcoS [Gammaproteobacteria bacterium]
MEILFVLVPASVVLMGIAMWVFVRAVDSGQFDHLDRHALDMFDNDEVHDNEHIGK